MSVTIAECLQLPALREAKCIAGHKGLNQAISTVSVLEYARISAMADQLFLGGELIITAFASVKDSVEEQCTAIQRLHDVGEVGMVLYYVGVFVPRIDQKLIDIADQLDFPLIIMPPNTYYQRYSDAMTEIHEAIFRDQQKEANIVPAIIERITKMHERQRTIDSALRLIGDRLHCSLLLLNRDGKERGFAAWPMTISGEQAEHFRQEIEEADQLPDELLWDGKREKLYHKAFDTDAFKGLQLFAIGETSRLNENAFDQAIEIVRMFCNIWQGNSLLEEADGLVRAILNDQTAATRRISENVRIDLKKIRVMWVISYQQAPDGASGEEQLREAMKVKAFLRENGKTVVADTFDNRIVAFMEDDKYVENDQELALAFMRANQDEKKCPILIWSGGMDTIQDVRMAYMLIESCFSGVRAIYPCQEILTLREFSFAQECLRTIEEGPSSVEACSAVLQPLCGQKDEEDLLATLSAFLIDCNRNVPATADRLYVHESTVKYRINKIERRLGYDVSQMPAQYALYRALAIYRLTKA